MNLPKLLLVVLQCATFLTPCISNHHNSSQELVVEALSVAVSKNESPEEIDPMVEVEKEINESSSGVKEGAEEGTDGSFDALPIDIDISTVPLIPREEVMEHIDTEDMLDVEDEERENMVQVPDMVEEGYDGSMSETTSILHGPSGPEGESVFDPSPNAYSPREDPGVLNVHVVPRHSSTGSAKSHDSIVSALESKPHRSFTSVEQRQFASWWEDASEERRVAARELAKSSRLNFANGGWSVHDEACTHFAGMIDNVALGQEFLSAELGAVPRVGWQVGSHGHSATQASFSSRWGMDAVYLDGIDHVDLKKRMAEQEAEGYWHPSEEYGEQPVFWGLVGEGYGGDGILLQDLDAVVRQRQVVESVFPQLAKTAAGVKDGHVMLTVGSDFENAESEYESFDLMIEIANDLSMKNSYLMNSIFDSLGYTHLNLFYSSPEYYTKMKHENGAEYQTKTDDFMPVAESTRGYATGFFTSHPELKRLERISSSFLMAARQVEAHAPTSQNTPLFPLDDALGAAQRIDAITGTSNKKVSMHTKLLQKQLHIASSFMATELKKRFLAPTAPALTLADFSLCPSNDMASCSVSHEQTRKGNRDLYVAVYNGLAQFRSSAVRLPVSEGNYVVSRNGQDGVFEESHQLTSRPMEDNTGHAIVFETGKIPPVGASMFKIEKISELDSVASIAAAEGSAVTIGEGIIIKYGDFEVHFTSSGELVKMGNAEVDSIVDVKQSWGYYTSHPGGDNEKPSGAKIFRPLEPNEKPNIIQAKKKKAKIVETEVGVEIHTAYKEDWIRQVTRVARDRDQPYLEIEYTIGPIPDDAGKEIVTQYHTDIQNDKTCFTDANGREFQERRHNRRGTFKPDHTEVVSSNYYPVDAAIFLQDANTSLAVITDRAQGGACLRDGAVELMVHRLNHALNGTAIIRGTHRLATRATMQGGGAKSARELMDGAFLEPLVFVGSATRNQAPEFESLRFSALGRDLPENVMLLTYQRKNATAFLVRLAHQYASGEDESGGDSYDSLSKPVMLNLATLFERRSISTVAEMTLGANQKIGEWMQEKIDWTDTEDSLLEPVNYPEDSPTTNVFLRPMDIRTFIITLHPPKPQPETSPESTPESTLDSHPGVDIQSETEPDDYSPYAEPKLDNPFSNISDKTTDFFKDLDFSFLKKIDYSDLASSPMFIVGTCSFLLLAMLAYRRNRLLQETKFLEMQASYAESVASSVCGPQDFVQDDFHVEVNRLEDGNGEYI